MPHQSCARVDSAGRTQTHAVQAAPPSANLPVDEQIGAAGSNPAAAAIENRALANGNPALSKDRTGAKR